MGCLPLPIVFLLGCGIGYALAGQAGALWGGGIGLLAGLALGWIVLKAMRKANRP